MYSSGTTLNAYTLDEGHSTPHPHLHLSLKLSVSLSVYGYVNKHRESHS